LACWSLRLRIFMVQRSCSVTRSCTTDNHESLKSIARISTGESGCSTTWTRALSKHDLKVVGYWVPEDAPGWDNTFVDITAYPSREEAKRNWDAMMADPEFQAVIKSEQANKLVEKVDSTYMRPTDFSPMK
jgi:hypothetical protein